MCGKLRYSQNMEFFTGSSSLSERQYFSRWPSSMSMRRSTVFMALKSLLVLISIEPASAKLADSSTGFFNLPFVLGQSLVIKAGIGLSVVGLDCYTQEDIELSESR